MGRREEASSELERVSSFSTSQEENSDEHLSYKNRTCGHPQAQYCMECFRGCEWSSIAQYSGSQEDNLRENLEMSQCPGGDSSV